MKKSIVLFSTLLIWCFTAQVLANSAPVVSNVTVSQRMDGSGMVDIYYTLSDADNDDCTVSIKVSYDGGSCWEVTVWPSALSGDLTNVSPGRRHITWNSKTDLSGEYGTNYKVKVTAEDGVFPHGPNGMVWVSINDPGVPGHESFNGQMSKYETTNAQYCQYLNSAKADGLITVYNNVAYAPDDIYHNRPYFDTYPTDNESQISYSGSVFSVRSRDGYDMSDHPVFQASWHGARAFCNYYGYRLPTEWEWQAVADYDGSYTYGCGTTIDHSKANYASDNPLGLSSSPYTTPAGYYPAYGYGMCDMAGNGWEWTDKCYDAGCDPWYGLRATRGGAWYIGSSDCTVSTRYSSHPCDCSSSVGFRVCR